MKNQKSQVYALIGTALIITAVIMVYIALSQPKVYEVSSSTAAVSVINGSSTSAAVQNSGTQNSVYSQSSDSSYVQTQTDLQVSFPLNINTATVEELQCVDGIGEKRAQQIVAYREQLGGYDSVSQIKNIKGIGDAVYESIAPYLTV